MPTYYSYVKDWRTVSRRRKELEEHYRLKGLGENKIRKLVAKKLRRG